VKDELLKKLLEFQKGLQKLKKDVGKINGERVTRQALRSEADRLATMWVEELRSQLEFKIRLPADVITQTSNQVKHLYILSRPNNLKSSYVNTVSDILDGFDNKFILPIKQTALSVDTVLDLKKLVPSLLDKDESEYLNEAIECANLGFARASIVMGWCAAIDRIHKKIMDIGLDKFNSTTVTMKNQTGGRFSRWNKTYTINSLSELQEVFDRDLIRIVEGMGLIDGNQTDRLLDTCFQYRNHSAHPGNAPIDEPHIVVFFNDMAEIVLLNPKFTV
jgi:hypothetical protein